MKADWNSKEIVLKTKIKEFDMNIEDTFGRYNMVLSFHIFVFLHLTVKL